jgi:methylated-DNA-protein-cysteine methyltransferase-like protein
MTPDAAQLDQFWQLVAQIPKGKVTTYGWLTKALWWPTPRLAGYVLHRNTDANRFPCHRVVMATGSLAPGYAFGGPEIQRAKLVAEGVPFRGNRVDLAQALWKP